MSTALTTTANERSSYFITITLYNENNAAIDRSDVKSCVWSLTNGYGDIINDLSEVVVNPITNPFTIILTGNDLQIEGNADEVRHLTVMAIYDSALEDNLEFKDYCTFTVKNLVAVDGTAPTASLSPSASASPSTA
jgi:hypothetical protein